jgi:hypothetical protein
MDGIPLWISDILDTYHDCRRFESVLCGNMFKADIEFLKAMFTTDREFSTFEMDTIDCDPGYVNLNIKLVKTSSCVPVGLSEALNRLGF